MSSRWLPHLLFILYCIEAGVFLVIAPWSGAWEGLLGNLPIARVETLLLEPWARGAISGFGLVHLVWGAHDLDAWLSRRKTHGRLRS